MNALGLPLPVCACCGVETTDLASVFDPWLGAVYGACIECIQPLHDQMSATLEKLPKGAE